MESINSINLLGNLGKDPETRQAGSTALCTFSLATSRKYRDAQGVVQTKTTWHRCVAFGKQAETISQYVKKGDPIYVRGRYESRDYEKDGQKRTIYEVAVEEFKFMGSRDKNESGEHRPQQSASPSQRQAAPARDPYAQQTYAQSDDDVPF